MYLNTISRIDKNYEDFKSYERHVVFSSKKVAIICFSFDQKNQVALNVVSVGSAGFCAVHEITPLQIKLQLISSFDQH